MALVPSIRLSWMAGLVAVILYLIEIGSLKKRITAL
jgi:hypothetical protein